jgi:hypothetical protein
MRFADNKFTYYKSESKQDLAMELYKTSFASVYASDLDDWCRQCAGRINEQFGYEFNYTDLDSFVDELIKYKLIMEIN